jgi:hypothetical protein
MAPFLGGGISIHPLDWSGQAPTPTPDSMLFGWRERPTGGRWVLVPMMERIHPFATWVPRVWVDPLPDPGALCPWLPGGFRLFDWFVK